MKRSDDLIRATQPLSRGGEDKVSVLVSLSESQSCSTVLICGLCVCFFSEVKMIALRK